MLPCVRYEMTKNELLKLLSYPCISITLKIEQEPIVVPNSKLKSINDT